VHQAQVNRAGLVVFFADVSFEDGQQVVIPGTVPLRGQIGGLYHDKQMVVLVEHRDFEFPGMNDFRHGISPQIEFISLWTARTNLSRAGLDMAAIRLSY
jgi:hypothetical protein